MGMADHRRHPLHTATITVQEAMLLLVPLRPVVNHSTSNVLIVDTRLVIWLAVSVLHAITGMNRKRLKQHTLKSMKLISMIQANPQGVLVNLAKYTAPRNVNIVNPGIEMLTMVS